MGSGLRVYSLLRRSSVQPWVGRHAQPPSSLLCPLWTLPIFGSSVGSSSFAGSSLQSQSPRAPWTWDRALDFSRVPLLDCLFALQVASVPVWWLESAAPKRRIGGSGTPAVQTNDATPCGHCLSSPFCWLVDGLAWLFWGCLCLSVDVRTALSLLSSTLLHLLRALHESLDGLLGSEACCAGRLGGVLAFGFLLVCNIGMLIVPGVSEGWDVMSLLALDLWGMPESVGACSRSVALGVLLALLCALRCHRSGGSNRHVKGRLWTCLVAPLACCSPSQPVLVWRRPPVPRCHRRTGCGNLQRWLIRLIGFSCLPQRVFAVPGDLLVELQGLDLGRSPHVAYDPGGDGLLPEALEDPLLLERWPIPFRVGNIRRAALGDNQAVRLVPGTRPDAGEGISGWLGVHVMCPFYQTEVWAVQCRRADGPDAFLREVDRLTADAFDVGLSCLVPVWPQRFIGCATVLRYATVLDDLSPPCAAIVFDLLRVGGHYYSAVVPVHTTTEELYARVQMLVRGDLDHVDIFVGAGEPRLTPGQRVMLDHGDVVACVPPSIPGPGAFALEDLFADECDWGPVEHIPLEIRTPSVGVVCGDELFTLHGCFNSRSSVREACIPASRLSDETVVGLSSAAFCNLNVCGEPCDRLIAITTAPARGLGLFPRRDIFVFCDLRPLCLEPRAFFLHSAHVHLESLASLLQIRVPAGSRLQVSGFLEAGDEVRVQSGSVLVFRVIRGVVPPENAAASDCGRPDVYDSAGSDWEHLPPLRPWEGFPSPRTPVRSPRSRTSYGSGSSRVAKWGFSGKIPLWDGFLPLVQPVGFVQYSCTLVLDDAFKCLGALLSVPFTCKQPDGAGLPNAVTGRSERPDARWRDGTDIPAARTAPFAPIDTDAYVETVTGVTDQPLSPWVNALFFVLAPERVPDVLLLPLRVPCSVEDALEAVTECRDADCARYFPSLHVARPQPDCRFAVVLSQPEWDPNPVILIDSSRVNSRVFCASARPRMSREALLGLIGIPADAAINVFVQDLLWALAPGQIAELYSGMTIFFCPREHPRPPWFQLRLMLFDVLDWDSEADLPAPAGEFFLLLTDTHPAIFHVHPARRGEFRSDIAALLGYEEQSLTVRLPNPRPSDASFKGILLQGVAVATAAIPRLPIPPALRRESCFILVIDARAILRSFLWRTFPDRFVPVSTLELMFDEGRPEGYRLNIVGAPIVQHPDGDCLCIEHGLLVLVDYVMQETVADEEPSSASDGGPSGSDDESRHSSSPNGPEDSPDSPESSSSHPSGRSRSPRRPPAFRRDGRELQEQPAVRQCADELHATGEARDWYSRPFACLAGYHCDLPNWCKCCVGALQDVPSMGHNLRDTSVSVLAARGRWPRLWESVGCCESQLGLGMVVVVRLLG